MVYHSLHWTHTASHRQSLITYCAVIETIIVPYKDASVLELLKKHRIVPLFVPPSCTDIMQECDSVVNKPFKNGVRNGYGDHMEELFQEHLRNGKDPTLFAPKFTMSALGALH